MRGTDDEWSIECRDFLIKAINDGKTYAQLARIMTPMMKRTITRSAIAGKVGRLRNQGFKLVAKGDRQLVAETNRQVARLRVRKQPTPKPEKETPVAEENIVRIRNAQTGSLSPAPKNQLFEMTDNAKSILELRYGQCRAPVGNGPVRKGDGVITPHMFCGLKATQGSYCESHAEVLFGKPKPPAVSERFILQRLGISK